jgi:hypothetical protein
MNQLHVTRYTIFFSMIFSCFYTDASFIVDDALDGYNSDCSVFSFASQKSDADLDNEFKERIKNCVAEPLLPINLYEEFNHEVDVPSKKRKISQCSILKKDKKECISEPSNDWELLIKKQDNKKLENLLYEISFKKKTSTLKNQCGQNPAHVACLTPGAENSLRLVAKIMPSCVLDRDQFDNLPENYIQCPASKKSTAKLDYINFAKRQVALHSPKS